MNRALRMLLAATVVSALIPATVAAHNVSPQHWNNGCTTDVRSLPDSWSEGIIVGRSSNGSSESSSTATGYVRGVGMKITARALRPCTGSGQEHSKSLQLATINGRDSGGGTYVMAQLGIGKTGHSGCGGWAANQTTFVYTPADTDIGILCKASWFDPDNDGTPNDPIGGRDYDFRITLYNNADGSNQWRYCITDTVTSNGDRINRTRSTNDGGLKDDSNVGDVAWWGYEIGNQANALGVGDSESNTYIFETRYQKASDSLWYYTENSHPYVAWVSSTFSGYHVAMSQTGLGESMNGYTDWHP